jgi:glucose-6-phosphate-specific signal transduction histidine kinase
MTETDAMPTRDLSVWRDLLLAAAVATACALFAAHIDLHEALFAYTRRWEALQLDELPIAVFVFAGCLVVLYARRLQQLGLALGDNRRLAQRTLDVQEAERKHLARELHDELGQHLNAIKLDAQALTVPPLATHDAGTVQRILINTDHVYGVVSDMIRRLRPAALDELGLVAALEACVDRWRASQPVVAVRLQTEGELDDLGENLSLAIYRIVQEGLTNCMKHAAARQVEVRLQRQTAARGGDAVMLMIVDDGAGMSPSSLASAGHGLAGMRERVSMLGGHFDLHAGQHGDGLAICASFPLQRARS